MLSLVSQSTWIVLSQWDNVPGWHTLLGLWNHIYGLRPPLFSWSHNCSDKTQYPIEVWLLLRRLLTSSCQTWTPTACLIFLSSGFIFSSIPSSMMPSWLQTGHCCCWQPYSEATLSSILDMKESRLTDNYYIQRQGQLVIKVLFLCASKQGEMIVNYWVLGRMQYRSI